MEKRTAKRVRVTVKETGAAGCLRGFASVDGAPRYRVDLDSGETVHVAFDSLAFDGVATVEV